MINLLVFIFLIATPAFAQLSPPLTGQMAQTPLIYYRVGFISKHKKFTEIEGNRLLDSLKDDPISEKYILKLKQQTDGTYEVEMLMKIMFFDKREAELAIKFLQEQPMFCTASFDVEIVECKS